MRLPLLAALLCLVTSVGCGDSEDSDSNGVPRSSFAACSFTQACADAAERCYVSQSCGPPAQDEPLTCRAEEGDRQCHRTCEGDTACGEGETCRAVDVSNRTDTFSQVKLCFK